MRYIALVLAALFMTGAAYAAEEEASGSMEEDQASMEAENTEGEDAWNFSEWDMDDDGQLDEEEFYAGYEESGIFDDWDVNDDGVLDEDELGDGLYDTWDYDEDGYLEEDEAEEYGFWDW